LDCETVVYLSEIRRGGCCKDNNSILGFGTKDQTKRRMIEAKAEKIRWIVIVLEKKDPSWFVLFSLSGEELESLPNSILQSFNQVWFQLAMSSCISQLYRTDCSPPQLALM
jgi:hypothetical protein